MIVKTIAALGFAGSVFFALLFIRGACWPCDDAVGRAGHSS